MIGSPTSFFNQRLPAGRPIDASSASYVASLVAQKVASGVTFNFRDWSVTHFTVNGAQTPKQKVWLDRKDGESPLLREAIAEVPIPAELRPPGPIGEGDSPVTVYDISTDTYYEFYRMWNREVDGAHTVAECSTLNEPGWHCTNASVRTSFSTSPGYFTGGAHEVGSGSSASGICNLLGTIKPAEAQALYIPHAIRLEFPTHQNTFRWPAQKTDGKSEDPTQPQEGMIFALPANYNVNAKVKDPFMRAIAVAARDFGLITTDTAGSVAFKCACEATKRGSQSYGTDAWKGPGDEYGSAGAIFTKKPGELMLEFPWADLEVLAESYRPSTNVPGVML